MRCEYYLFVVIPHFNRYVTFIVVHDFDCVTMSILFCSQFITIWINKVRRSRLGSSPFVITISWNGYPEVRYPEVRYEEARYQSSVKPIKAIIRNFYSTTKSTDIKFCFQAFCIFRVCFIHFYFISLLFSNHLN